VQEFCGYPHVRWEIGVGVCRYPHRGAGQGPEGSMAAQDWVETFYEAGQGRCLNPRAGAMPCKQ